MPRASTMIYRLTNSLLIPTTWKRSVEVAIASKRGISYIHAAPGAVASSWGNDFPWYAKYPVRILQLFAKTPEACAVLMIEGGLTSPTRQGQGYHIMSEKGQVAKVTNLHNDKYREAVWKHTNEVIDKALQA